jgi:diguanylate cyclase (GGDEF)-like protein
MGKWGNFILFEFVCWLTVLFAMPAWAGGESVSVSYYDNYPLCFQNEKGEAQGLFIDVLKEAADQEGWDLTYEYHTFEDQLDLVAQGKVDLGVAVAYTEGRAQHVSYLGETVYSNWGQVYVGEDYSSVDSLDALSRYRIALVRGDLYAADLVESFEFLGLDGRFVYVDGFSDVFAAMDDGRAEAGAVARTFGLLNMDQYGVKATSLALHPSKVKIIATPGQENLLAGVDRWLLGMQADSDSKYYDILSRWLREEVQEEVVPEWLKWVLGLAALTGLISLAFAYFMRKMVAEQTKELRYLAFHDPLTSLPNRRYMKQLLDGGDIFKACDFLLLDLDQFRRINDVYGHEMGDRLLIELAGRIKETLPDTAVFSRLSGDEFTLLLPESQGQAYGRELLAIMRQALQVGDELFQLGISMGLASMPEDGSDYDTLVKKAEMAMYQAKIKGNDKLQVFRPELEEWIHQTHWHVRHLRRAVERREFHLLYQPIVDTQSQKMLGVEALLRWEHEGKLISPQVFIPIAEQTGLIHDIGDWVVDEAVGQLLKWKDVNDAPGFMSVNLSAVQLNRPGFIEALDGRVDALGADKSAIHFEVTENAEIEKIGNSRRALEDLKARGYCISLDDFGMGYSSMNYLKELPLDTMKIDRAFIMEIGRDRETEIMIEELLILAKRMNLATIAEGVETEEQWAFLKEKGCSMIQGYYFGRPVRPDQLMKIKKN